MKTIFLASAFAFCLSVGALAQGVHLGPGDSIAIGFDHVDSCQPFPEPINPGGIAFVLFGADAFDLGDSLRLDIFENSLSDPPIVSVGYVAPATVVDIGAGGAWQDFQGIVRVAMLSGSADVLGIHFAVFPNSFTHCDIDVA